MHAFEGLLIVRARREMEIIRFVIPGLTWNDESTLVELFHHCRQLRGKRILLLG